jgi:hypothetical protein
MIESSAVISADGEYRYELRRTWGSGEIMAWVLCNPSTADATKDDMTARKCMGFARLAGYEGIVIVNLYARRCTRPVHLLDPGDPEGPENISAWDRALTDHNVGMIVAAWGSSIPKRVAPSRALAAWSQQGWFCLGKTASRSPRHPSRLGYDTELVPLRTPR